MPPDVLPLIRSRANRWYVHDVTSSVRSWYSVPEGWGLELGREDVWGMTCGVETKCILSLHTICSGMHLIKIRYESQGVCVCICVHRHAVLYASTVCVCIQLLATTENTVHVSFRRTFGFSRLLTLRQFSCKCRHTLLLVHTGHGKPRCSPDFKSAPIYKGESSLHGEHKTEI